MPQELPVTHDERGEEISLTVFITILHELFEFAAHVLCAHVWRIGNHGGVLAGKILCLSENFLCSAAEQRIEQRTDAILIFRH